MATNEKPQIIVLDPATKTVEDLLKVIEEKSQADVIRVKDPDEAQQLARHHQPCMLFACIQENAEIPARVNMLKKLEASIKKGLIKTLFVSKIKNRQINTLITSLGVTDFMEEPVPVRTMFFKANLQIKAVQLIRKQQAQKVASEERIIFKSSADGKKAEEGGGGAEAKKAPALELKEDTFLFRNSGVRKVGKKLLVELEGPTPDSGEWVPHEDKGDAQSSWRWVPKKEEENSPPADPTEGWVHEGDKPTYQEATGKWQMASDKPELAFRKNGEKLAKKITTDETGEVVVAADSPAAEERVEKLKLASAKKKEALAKAEIAKEQPENSPAKDKLSPIPAEAKEKASTLRVAEQKAPPEGTTKEANAPADPAAEKAEKQSAALKLEKEAAETSARPVLAKEVAPAKKKALSPVDFLKKKKEELNRALPISMGEEEEEEATTKLSPPKEPGSEEAEREKIALAPALVNGKAKKSPASAAQAMLDRMKAKLGEGETNTDPLAEEPESPPEAEEEEEDTEEAGPQLVKNKKTKVIKKPQLTLALKKEQREGREKNALPILAEKKRVKKKELLLQIQEILNQPLPEELPPEQEQEIRQELGLENDPAIKGKDLARKKRLKQVKDLKAQLGELDSLPETEEAPALTTHDLSVEDPENTWSSGEKNPGREGTKIRAFDSDAKDTEEDDASLDPLSRVEANKKKKLEQIENYVYLPRSDVKPLGGAWEKAGSYFVFLAGEVRYHGFSKLEDLLPLWVFDGEQIPELLDRIKQWRFRGKLPLEVKTVDQIPREVRDHLLAIKDQLTKEKESAADEPDSREGTEEAESESVEARKTEKNSVEAQTTAQREPKKEKRDLNALLASMESEQEALALAPETAGEEPTKPEEMKPDEPESVAGKKVRPQEVLESTSESGGLKNDIEEESPGISARVTKELSPDSPAIDSFQERRKRKKEAKAALPDLGLLPPSSLSQTEGPNNPYLAVFVTLSNSLGPHKDPARSILKVLKAIEGGFRNCQVFYLAKGDGQGSAPVLQSVTGEVPEGSMLALSSGLHREIRDGESAEILGYLLLTPTSGREGFLPTEERAMDKVARSFSGVVMAKLAAKKAA